METMYVLLIRIWICMGVWAEWVGEEKEHWVGLRVARRRTGFGIGIGVPITIA
jgi:hypothetical protein